MKTKRNIIASLLMQVFTILSGIILPRLILHKFGSNVSGSIASINQFLNYISLIEGGIGGVIVANLYKPLVRKDEYEVNKIVNSATSFFKKIALIYLVYLILVALVYGVFIHDFSWSFFFFLTLVLGINTLLQYYFSLSYRLLLQADGKLWVWCYIHILALVLNVIITYILIKRTNSILLVKLFSDLIFLLQPILINIYVKRHYNIDKSILPDENTIKQRWDGFAQNLSYFIHMNTDIVILTFFSNLKEVSVYSIYQMITNGISGMIIAFSNGLKHIIGKTIASDDLKKSNVAFDIYSFVMFYISSIGYSCCISLILSFAKLYTKGITDANYDRPYFAIILSIASLLYCWREPFMVVIYSAGHYKQTNKSAYYEAAINIFLSVLLVNKFGISGVAIGTAFAMLFRMMSFIIYLSNNILYRSVKRALKELAVFTSAILLSAFVINLCKFEVNSIGMWIKMAIISVLVSTLITTLFSWLFDRNRLYLSINSLFSNNSL